ncbi:hypothetical protein [Streptomyces sp. NPDC001594]|uniref:hypothetical protein n=1 Tax=Streptomyces sp. NPDC001594 TaxID=3364590 RepID=UPI003694C531
MEQAAEQRGETAEKEGAAPNATGAVDLIEALRASVDRARSLKATGEKAAKAGIRGRSHMTHDELADALAHRR